MYHNKIPEYRGICLISSKGQLTAYNQVNEENLNQVLKFLAGLSDFHGRNDQTCNVKFTKQGTYSLAVCYYQIIISIYAQLLRKTTFLPSQVSI